MSGNQRYSPLKNTGTLNGTCIFIAPYLNEASNDHDHREHDQIPQASDAVAEHAGNHHKHTAAKGQSRQDKPTQHILVLLLAHPLNQDGQIHQVNGDDGQLGRVKYKGAGPGLGQIGQVEYIVKKIREETGYADAKVVASGGLGNIIAKETNYIDYYDPQLTLKGLKIIYEKNKK